MKKLITSALFILLVLPGMTQTLQKNDELKFDADYFLMRGDFDKALDNYLQVLQSEPENADIMYRIGICYLNSEDNKGKAIDYLYEASKNVSVRYNTNSFKEFHSPIEVYFLLGSAYRVNNQLEEAIAAYEKYKEFLDPKDKYNREATDQYIRNCQLATELLKKPHNVTFTNLGNVINNNLANFNPVVSGDGKILVFTSPGKQGYDIFISSFNDSVWSVPRNISPALGGGKYMKTSSLSFDGTTLLLNLEDPENSDLYISYFKKGRWSKAEPLSKEINSKWNETNGSFSADGRTLYFTSNRKGGEGDLDIYRSALQGDVWSAPQNLGAEVNTPYNEETPFVSADHKELYFSSEGHMGIGGYDVFKYDLSDQGKGVVNLGYPVNTTDNNLFYVPAGDGSTAYYAFRGPDTYGGRDIYHVTVIPDPPEPELMAVTPEAVAMQPEPEKLAVEPEAAAVEPEATIAPATVVPEKETAVIVPETETSTVVPEVATGMIVADVATTTIIQEGATTTIIPEAAAATVVPEASAATVVPEAAVATVVAEEVVADEPLVPESPAIEPTPVSIVPEAVAVVAAEPEILEPVSAPVASEPEAMEVEPKPVEEAGKARSYTVQFMALKKPVDIQYFRELSDISITLGPDAWYRYTWITTTDSVRADKMKKDLVSKGFADAFIRRKSIVPRFTVQVMAVPGPVTDLNTFANLPEISVRKDSDTFCRYTTGWFESRDDARNALAQIRSLGYPKAFVRKVKTLQ